MKTHPAIVMLALLGAALAFLVNLVGDIDIIIDWFSPDQPPGELMMLEIGVSQRAVEDMLGPPLYERGVSNIGARGSVYLLEQDLVDAGTYFDKIEVNGNVDATEYFDSLFFQRTYAFQYALAIARFETQTKELNALRFEVRHDEIPEGACVNVAKIGPLRKIMTADRALCLGIAPLANFFSESTGSIAQPFGPDWEADCEGGIDPGGTAGSRIWVRCQSSPSWNGLVTYDISVESAGKELGEGARFLRFDRDDEHRDAAWLSTLLRQYGRQPVNVVTFYGTLPTSEAADQAQPIAETDLRMTAVPNIAAEALSGDYEPRPFATQETCNLIGSVRADYNLQGVEAHRLEAWRLLNDRVAQLSSEGKAEVDLSMVARARSMWSDPELDVGRRAVDAVFLLADAFGCGEPDIDRQSRR